MERTQIFDGNLESVCAALEVERKILKRSGLSVVCYASPARPIRVMADAPYVKEKSPFYQKKFTSVYRDSLGKWQVPMYGSRQFVFMGGFRTSSPHNPGGTGSGAGNILWQYQPKDRADHHAENLRQYRSTEAPVNFFTERSDADGGFL